MAHGKRFDEWDRASLLAALIHNDPQGLNARIEPHDFNPFSKRPKTADADTNVTTIRNPADLAAALGNPVYVVR